MRVSRSLPYRSPTPHSLCDFVLGVASDALRSIWNRTRSDGRERAVTLFRRRNGRYVLTPVKTGTSNGVRTVPPPNGSPYRVNIHTHPAKHSTGLSVVDYHTFTRSFIVGAPFDVPPPRPAGYAVVGARIDRAGDLPGPAISVLRPTSAVHSLGAVERSELSRRVRSASSPEEASDILRPYHQVSSAQF